MKMNETTFLSVFEGVPVFEVRRELLEKGTSVADLCAGETSIFPSKGELRRMVQGGGLSFNKQKIDNADMIVPAGWLLNNKYLLVQKGKKNYYLIKVG
jgi:tyrosyl-tRNA synthetase